MGTHLHRKIANHSPEQQAKFFAEANALGFNEREVKERAKKYFKLPCFNDLNKNQLSELIEKLVATRESRSYKDQKGEVEASPNLAI